MGISTEQWRSTIGCFSQPLKSITRLKNIKLRYSACVSFGVRTLLFLLLVVQGVEANPGPPRGRGRGSKGASGFGPPTGRGAGSTDYFSDNPNPDMAPLSRSQRLHEPSTNRQSSLNAWLTTSQSTPNQNTDINTDMNTNMNTNQENLTEFAPETPSEASGESESEVFSELDVDLSRIPSQSLSQMEVVVPDTETQHRTQTQGISQRNLTSTARGKQAIFAPSRTRVSSPGPSKRKETEKQRSPSPTKPSSPTSRQTRHSRSPSPVKQQSARHKSKHSRSPSPAPQTRVKVKEEPKSQPEILSSSKKRSRPVIEDDSDDDLALPHGSKRVKVEPETPRSNTGRVEKKKHSVPNYASDSEGNEDEDEFDKIDARITSKRNRKTSPKSRNPKSASASEDEFDKIDARINSKRNRRTSPKSRNTKSTRASEDDEFDKIDARISSKRNRQTSPKPRNTKPASASDDEFDKIDDRISSKRTRKTSPKPRNSKSASVSPNREDIMSPARLNVNRRKSPSPGIETAERSARVKTEVTDIESTSSRGRSNKGQTRTGVNGLDPGAVDRGSGNRGVRKVEVENDDYEMSAVLRVEDSEDTKHNVVSNAPVGFLSTRRPIEDQMPCNRDFEAEPDQPSNCIKIEVVSLVARRPPRRDHANDDCPDGFTRWKGKLVKNFKKFKKTQSGHFGLPTVIGGSDLVVHVPQRSKELDDWFKETVQAESQHASEDRRAQELFDFNPSRRKGR